MIYNIDALQALHFHNFIKDIDLTTFRYGADRKEFENIKVYFNAIVAQSIYIKNLTGDYPKSIQINYNYLCWIIENVGDGVINSHNETIKYLNK